MRYALGQVHDWPVKDDTMSTGCFRFGPLAIGNPLMGAKACIEAGPTGTLHDYAPKASQCTKCDPSFTQ
jgi:hypothetical protein